MSSNKPTPATDWKQLLREARAHYQKLTACCWRMTKSLVAMFDDAEFRAEVGARDDHQTADWIDAEFPGLPLRFLQLRAVLAEYPRETDWKGKKLVELFEAIRDSAEVQERPARTQRRVTLKQFEELGADRDHWKTRAEYLEERTASLERERAEDARTVQRLEGRIEELERLLAREPVAA